MEVAMKIRDALIMQSPSLELQRAAADEIAALDARVEVLTQLHYQDQARLAKVDQAVVAAFERDNELNDKEQSPTGDDYNNLFDYVAQIHMAVHGG